MSEELGDQLRTEMGARTQRVVRQQPDALLPALLKSIVHTSVNLAREDCIASLERKMAQMIEKVASLNI